MIELVYVSRSVQRLDQLQLVELLRQCRKNNQANKVTGLLLYDGFGTFIQALEGEESTVDKLFTVIKQDPRHDHVHMLGHKTIQQRAFSDWRMGFRTLTQALVQQTEGYSDFLSDHQPISAYQQQPGFAFHMLDYFKQRSSTETEDLQDI